MVECGCSISFAPIGRKMSVEVFLGNCVKFVFSIAKFIGLVSPHLHHHRHHPPSPDHITVNRSDVAANAPDHHQKQSSGWQLHQHPVRVGVSPHPDAASAGMPNNRQLLYAGVSWWRNRIPRFPTADLRRRQWCWWWCFSATSLLCLTAYPWALHFAKKCSPTTEATRTSYFNLFVFITLYFHYVLMAVACVLVVGQGWRNRSVFTAALEELYSLTRAICNSVNMSHRWDSSPSSSKPQKQSSLSGGDGASLEGVGGDNKWSWNEKGQELLTGSWIRCRSIDLGLKCGPLALIFVVLCWLSINLPILTGDNWITIFATSVVLILPTVLLRLLSVLFYTTSVTMECLLLVINAQLKHHCMRPLQIHVHKQAQFDLSTGVASHQQQKRGRPWYFPGHRSHTVQLLSICDNVDVVVQLYSRALNLLKQLNHFHGIPVLLVILNCFFNVAVQSFSIYMTLNAVDSPTNNNAIAHSIIGVLQDDNTTTIGSGHADAWTASKESSSQGGTLVPHFYIIAVNSVYILINYCELWTTIRASTGQRTAVSIRISGTPAIGSNSCGAIIFQSYPAPPSILVDGISVAVRRSLYRPSFPRTPTLYRSFCYSVMPAFVSRGNTVLRPGIENF